MTFYYVKKLGYYIFLIIIWISFLYWYFFSLKGRNYEKKLKNRILYYEKQNQELKSQKNNLYQEYFNLLDDAYLEKKIQGDLNYISPNSIIYIVDMIQ